MWIENLPSYGDPPLFMKKICLPRAAPSLYEGRTSYDNLLHLVIMMTLDSFLKEEKCPVKVEGKLSISNIFHLFFSRYKLWLALVIYRSSMTLTLEEITVY